MASITRRQLLKGGGASLFAAAAASLAACAANEAPEPPAQEATAAPTPETSGVLKLNDDKLIDRSCFVGVDEPVELADGTKTPMINFDNAATTPALSTVVTEVVEALPLYGSIGRGKGQKSAASTARFNDARQTVLDFFGAPAAEYTCGFTGTATDALNKISGALVTSADDVVLTTRSEHHANDLPWREKCEVRYVEVDENGRLIMDQFEELLADGKVTIVSCQAASNVTGYVHDVHAIAKMAHAAGAIMVVDGAQIAAHRAFSLKGDTAEADIGSVPCIAGHQSPHKRRVPDGLQRLFAGGVEYRGQRLHAQADHAGGRSGAA